MVREAVVGLGGPEIDARTSVGFPGVSVFVQRKQDVQMLRGVVESVGLFRGGTTTGNRTALCPSFR